MNNLQIKAANDRLFAEGNFSMTSEYFADFPLKENRREGHFSVKENTVSMTSTECIISNKGSSMAVLNFANAMQAGGAYILGGNAQEEALCRCSLLYYTIKSCNNYYTANRLHVFPDYTDGMIYSENVPVIRDDKGDMLGESISCSFITCPAVNRRFARMLMSDRKIKSIMERRIGRIISLSASKAPDTVILGAFGCGVFGNKREVVFELFENAIDRYGGNDVKYIFAVPD